MKIVEKTIKIIFNILLSLLVILAILVAYNFFQVRALKNQYAIFFGYTMFEVQTGSMSNTIEINDAIIVKITKDVNENDIVTYLNDDEIITHRIIKKDNDKIITKGDANNEEDKPITSEQIIGKVVKIFPKFGIWIKVFSDLKVISCIIITLVLFGLAISGTSERQKRKSRHSFLKMLRNMRGKKRNGEKKEEKKK